MLTKDKGMKKRKTIIIVLLISLISMLFSINIYNRIKVQNIFDEIYYDSKNASGDGFERRSSLGNIKGMQTSAMVLNGVDAPSGKQIISESYSSESLTPSLKSLSITNDAKKETLSIAYSYEITSDLRIFFENLYAVKTKKMMSKITFVEIASGKRITAKNEVKDTIAEHNLTNKQLTTWYEEGLNKKFLSDWTKVYPSKYSPENPGEVISKTEWK